MDVKKIIEKESPHSVFQGESLSKLSVARIPSGIFVFDLLTGGGIPVGHFTEFHGAESTGKSMMALRMVGQFQRQFPNQSAIYVDLERTVTHKWASNWVGERGRFHLLHPKYGEQAVDWAVKYLQADDVGMVVIDSIAHLISVKEGEGDASDQFVAMNARLVGRMLRMFTLALADIEATGRTVTVIFVNQIRVKFGAQSFQSQVEKPGGRYLRFLNSLDVRFYRKEYKKIGNTPFAVVNTFTVKKNKLGLPERSGEFIAYLAAAHGREIGYVDDAKVILDFARKLNLLTQAGKGWAYGKIVHPTLPAWLTVLQDDRKLATKLSGEILSICEKDSLAGSSDSKEKDQEEGE